MEWNGTESKLTDLRFFLSLTSLFLTYSHWLYVVPFLFLKILFIYFNMPFYEEWKLKKKVFQYKHSVSCPIHECINFASIQNGRKIKLKKLQLCVFIQKREKNICIFSYFFLWFLVNSGLSLASIALLEHCTLLVQPTATENIKRHFCMLYVCIASFSVLCSEKKYHSHSWNCSKAHKL